MQLGSSRQIDGREGNELFEALTHRRRRRVLGLLRSAGEPTALSAIAAELAAHEDCDDPVERIEIALYHRHVPKLAATDLVAFDADRKTLRLTGTVPESVDELGLTPVIE